ncbi:MAG TPA: transglycosylase domain-containing protein [Nocardioidaceae bacterium]|nr:transglycosylase domain-containing protein [Nocardioidaceae bacterium]
MSTPQSRGPSTPRSRAADAARATRPTGAPGWRNLTGWARVRYAARKALKWGSISALVVAILAAVTIYVTYQRLDIPDPNTAFQAQTTRVYYSDGKHVLGEFELQNRESVPLASVPQSLQDAVISAEDRSFETNRGIDVKGIVRAAWNNLRSNGVEQGASTITQQYVKVLYLSQERTWERKIKEAFLAVKLQNTLSKDEILEGYLNTIYFGRGAYGVQAAAQAYFTEDVEDLSVSQSATLAAVLNSPGNLDPANGRDAAAALLDRYRYVLDGMVSMGSLDATQGSALSARLPGFSKVEEVNAYGGQRGYLMTLVRDQLQAVGFTNEQIDGGGLRVTTTFDWDKQRAAGRAVEAVRPEDRAQLHIALASVEPGTGALRAMIGGRNFLDSQINWATAGGSPGSTFKPFALAAALSQDFTLRSRFDGNSPLALPDGSLVENEGSGAGTSYGSVDLITATEQSINTAYVDMTLQMEDGPRSIVDAAVAAGVPRTSAGLTENTGVALGSATISTLAMADGYATFAAQGQQADWHVISRVTDPRGVQYEHLTTTDRAFSADVTSNVSYALQQVIRSGTGFRAQALGRPAAGKTGTATNAAGDVSSSWFVGYTPQLSTAVMYVRGDGNDALNGYLDTYYGQDYPTETWTAYMTRALQGEPVEDFPAPATLQGVSPTSVPPPTTAAPTPTSDAPPSTPSSSAEPTTMTPTTTAPTTTAPTTTAPTTSAPPPPSNTQPPTSAPPPPSSEPPPSSAPPPTSAPPTSAPPPSSGEPPPNSAGVSP